jgi:hypothetical protein
MELAVLAQAFHGEDALLFTFKGEEQARKDGPTVDQDRASTALAELDRKSVV